MRIIHICPFMILIILMKIPVLKRCSKCGGKKEVPDEAGNTSLCTTCDDNGKVTVPVPWREFAANIGREISKQARL